MDICMWVGVEDGETTNKPLGTCLTEFEIWLKSIQLRYLRCSCIWIFFETSVGAESSIITMFRGLLLHLAVSIPTDILRRWR